jgi:hypothetical protein
MGWNVLYSQPITLQVKEKSSTVWLDARCKAFYLRVKEASITFFSFSNLYLEQQT